VYLLTAHVLILKNQIISTAAAKWSFVVVVVVVVPLY